MHFNSEKQFKQFYTTTFPLVRAFLFSKCGVMSLSEDLAQESFVRLWTNKDKVEVDKAKSFLFTVANNLFLDHTRHHKVISNYNQSFVLKNEVHDPQYLIEMEEFKTKLETTIQSIPEASREVFLLNRMEKMTYVQIADCLGLSVKAIEKRMQKALEILSHLKFKV